ncbi:hypothetical protein COO91_01362 [Nostoc flagelliforme CCNUN1]|uniref:Uncharacterized protein n=1 Tax=Nostoc flagelliforme CCNUN1 TaxID=2038116 RepID=A0A2K8SJ71_9NOSO|nr:hypothetical protein [Nostoc flagelliforme]AUB35482.1 hypothetical protein COO91_01362 [Nostoc flagelliforme CCNUN1]
MIIIEKAIEEFTIAFVLQRLKFLEPVFRLGGSSESSHGGLTITSLRLPAASPGGYWF